MLRLIRLAWPLMANMALQALLHAIDQRFLAELGPVALAASFPASLTGYLIACLFIAAASYTGTFAAQHIGAGESDQAGRMVWPGLVLAGIGGVIGLSLISLRSPIFLLYGAEPAVHAELCVLGAWYFANVGPSAALAALNGCFGGVNRPGLVALVGGAAFVLNIVLTWALVFGHLGLPALGVAGAGLATVLSTLAACGLGLAILLGPLAHFGTRRPALDRASLYRFARFSVPHGSRELIEVGAWQVFTIVIAHFGTAALAASNAVIRWNLLTFIPLIGLSQAISILAGEAIGRGDPDGAARTGRRGLLLGWIWIAVLAIPFLGFPQVLVGFFAETTATTPEMQAAILAFAAPMCLVAAIWGLFDATTLAFRGVLAGAGDTRWPFAALIVCAILGFVLPQLGLLWVERSGRLPGGHPALWSYWLSLIFQALLMLALWWRFRAGHWRGMSVRG